MGSHLGEHLLGPVCGRDGLTVDQVADEVGHSARTVSLWLRDVGVGTRTGPHRQWREAVARWRSGERAVEVAASLNPPVDVSQLSRWAKKIDAEADTAADGVGESDQ